MSDIDPTCSASADDLMAELMREPVEAESDAARRAHFNVPQATTTSTAC